MNKIAIIPILLLMLIPSVQAYTIQGNIDENTISGTIFTTNETNVKSLKLTTIKNRVTYLQQLKLNLTSDTALTQINHVNYLPWWSEGIEIPLLHYRLVVNQVKSETIYVYTSTTNINATTYLTQYILGYPIVRTFTETYTVSDDDPTITLTAKIENTLGLDVDWTFESSSQILTPDITEIPVTDNGIIEYLYTLISTVKIYISLLSQIIGYISQIAVYIPLILAFYIVDALATGLIKGNWTPMGAIATKLVEILTSSLNAIGNLIQAIRPW